MPSRAYYHQTNDGCLTRDQEFPFSGITLSPSANEFSDNISVRGIEEWDPYMIWDDSTALDSVESSRPDSSGASSSKTSYWAPDTDLKPFTNTDLTKPALEDLPFEDDETASGVLDYMTSCDPERQYNGYGYTSLTITEEMQLREIAMPSRKRSVSSVDTESLSSSYFEPKTETSTIRKKRRSVTKAVATDVVEQKKRNGHNAIEKRYRTHLNEKINLLRDSVPSLRVVAEGEVPDEDAEERDPVEKCGKAIILTRAAEYITYLESCAERLGGEAQVMKVRVAAFEKLAMAGSFRGGEMQMLSLTPMKTESLESIKADFQQSTHEQAEKMRAAEPKTSRRRNTKKVRA